MAKVLLLYKACYVMLVLYAVSILSARATDENLSNAHSEWFLSQLEYQRLRNSPGLVYNVSRNYSFNYNFLKCFWELYKISFSL